ncbi:reticulocyte-binding protein homolog 2a [Euwallacea fornicatus]|uniref:reticulocyte-binding protein homolog 2a n=1 Tax=Euwallacea fornicatus TaxID=995702 RepID=UPI00339005C1
MNNHLFVLVWIGSVIWTVRTEKGQSLDLYLLEQSDNLDSRLAMNADESEEPILSSIRHENTPDDPRIHVYTLFNKTFISINEEVFLATMRRLLSMELYSTFEIPETVFFKVFEYEKMGFLAVSTPNEILVYTIQVNETVPTFVQSILAPNSAEGLFFTNKGSVYLISGTNGTRDMASISIYKWVGTYFDRLDLVYTSRITALGSFAHKNSEIVIAGQSSDNYEMDSWSSVYMFKQEKLRKIQHLRLRNPVHMNIFLLKNIPHVLIYEEGPSQKLYKWNGYELVHKNTFHWKEKIEDSLVVYANSTPFIVHVQKEKFAILKPQKDTILPYKTKSYRENYSVILGIDKGENERGNITFIAGLNADNIINISGMSLGAHAEIETEQDQALRRCFHNLEEKVYDRRTRLNQMSNYVAANPTEERKRNPQKRDTSNATEEDTNKEANLTALTSRLNKLKLVLNTEGNSTQLVVSGQVIIRGNITAKTITANNLVFNTTNGKKWSPDLWLRSKKEQTIKGPVNIESIKTKVLVTNGKASRLFEDLLRSNDERQITGQFKVKNIIVPKIYAQKINNIDVHRIVKKNNSAKIKGVKSFENVFARNSTVLQLNGEPLTIAPGDFRQNIQDLKFANHVYIENLDTEYLDGIKWSEFEKTVFEIGSDSSIEGNLTVPEITLNSLETKFLNGIQVKDIMTKTTEQNITTDIKFFHIDAFKIESGTVNRINISNSVLIDKNATVKGKVNIDHIEVKNNLKVLKNDIPYTIREGHVFGTNQSDLIQRYSGKIIIRGNLYINDLIINPNSTMDVNGKDYTTDAINGYWTKNGDQEIPVHLEAMDGVSVSHLNTNFINDVPISNFAVNNNDTEIKSRLVFENVTVNGDVLMNDQFNKSVNLTSLISETVRNDGKRYVIKGRKVFRNTLVTKILEDNVNKTLPQKFFEKKSFRSIIVKGNLKGNIWTETINNMPKTENLIMLNSPQNLSNLSLKNASVEKLYVKTINNYNVKEYLKKLDVIINTTQLNAINVKGHLSVQHVENLNTINDHNILNLINQSNSQRDTKADLVQDIKFFGKIHVDNLVAATINKIDFSSLTKRILHTGSNQSVSGRFTFNNLKTEHLITKMINEFNVTNLIDASSKKPQVISASGGITLRNTNLDDSVKAIDMHPCNIYEAMNHIRSPQSQEWREMVIIGNVTFLDENSDLAKIINKSVKKGENNVILAPVTINGDVVAHTVTIKDKLNKIDLEHLIEDAVFTDSEEDQIITGYTKFQNTIGAESLTVTGNSDVLIVNDFFIPELPKRIIPADGVNNLTILGEKVFLAGLQTDKLLTDRIVGINPDNIVSTAKLRPIPNAAFDSVRVENNLNVKNINNLNLDYVLKNRLLTNTTEKQVTNATYYFTDLEIKENIQAKTVNKIHLENVVFDVNKQKVKAPKIFMDNITFLGNVTVNYLNNIDVAESYNDSVFRRDTDAINGSITILKSVKFENNININKINGFPLDEIKRIIDTKAASVEEENIFGDMSKIKAIIKDNMASVQNLPKDFMYIQNSEYQRLGTYNATDAREAMSKDSFTKDIISEESHEKCNLPHGCKCSVQYSYVITPQLSIISVLKKSHQRVFSYENGFMSVHFSTNSISTSSKCRANNTDDTSETSTMIWNTFSMEMDNGSFQTYPSYFKGYISDVKFFTSIKGVTYAIVAKYYDPIADTHDLNCSVFKFNGDRRSALEIQSIPSYGAWTLYLLPTDQGVVLVIGNLGKQPSTEIYRFNETHEKFVHLRSLSFGYTKIEGVVVEKDSMIILANAEEPVHILKYHPKWDNYYYYQNFVLDEPVLGLSTFYMGSFGSDAYLCIVTEDNYKIYSFQYTDGWILESQGIKRGLKNLIPLNLNGQLYLFAHSTSRDSLLQVVTHT